ncbi:hypothetical protein M5689_024557 [Euphorbia peplus]|nr:hypothetical protein M5689_024557 [Euphorbia peplus]
MVTLTNPSEFLSVVQELTGKHAKIVLDTAAWSPNCNIAEAAARVVPKHETRTDFKMDSEESSEDFFSNNTSSSSSSAETDQDSVFWSNLPENFFEFKFDSIFCD